MFRVLSNSVIDVFLGHAFNINNTRGIGVSDPVIVEGEVCHSGEVVSPR